jgi:hypothetical protein
MPPSALSTTRTTRHATRMTDTPGAAIASCYYLMCSSSVFGFFLRCCWMLLCVNAVKCGAICRCEGQGSVQQLPPGESRP